MPASEANSNCLNRGERAVTTKPPRCNSRGNPVKKHKKLKDSAAAFVHCVAGMELLLIKYGLVAVFLAAMLEADVIPVLAGVAAHRGYFDPPIAVAVASFGALAGDCVWFFLGRSGAIRKSKLMLRLKSKAEIFFRRVGHWQVPASHIIYGTRVATMTFLGARGSSFGRFVLVDGVSCLALTTLLFCLGFALSASVSMILVDVKRIELVLLGAVALFALIFHLLQRFGRKLANI
jgi:membrane protein DedA with SNARE-associated domain